MPSNPKTILLVDDDPDLRNLLSARLHAAGYDVVCAGSGEEALNLMEHMRPNTVITDLPTPGMDGMALFEHIQRQQPSLPVIMLSAHGSISDAVAAAQNGVFGYLTKPFDSHALLQQVDRATRLSAASPATTRRTDSWRSAIISRSHKMDDLLEQARQAAVSDASILIQGESGTGKQLLARAIHQASDRADKPFVATHCSAIAEPQLDAEMFGQCTSANASIVEDRPGLFREADGGTLFLNEVDAIPLHFQTRLLRALQQKEVRPVGSSQTCPVDVRIISATHCDLDQAVAHDRFRDDFYYRLNVILLEIPPLRERPEDIPLLIDHFLQQLTARSRSSKVFSPAALELMMAASWPGNVRQLQNVVEQTCIQSPTRLIPAALVTRALPAIPDTVQPLVESKARFEREYLVRLLRVTGGNISRAARLAGRNRSEFYRLLSRHRLEPSLFRHKKHQANAD